MRQVGSAAMVRLLGALAVSIAALLPCSSVLDTAVAARRRRRCSPSAPRRSPTDPRPPGSSPTWTPARSSRAATSTSPIRRPAPSRCCSRWWSSTSCRSTPRSSPARPTPTVECNCAGVKAGRTYTTQELLDGLLLVSGNDAANTLAHMLGGTDVAVAKMNAKAAALGATGDAGRIAVRAQRARHRRLHHAARPGRHLPRRAGQPGVRRDHVVPDRAVPRRGRARDADQPGRDAGPLPRHARRQDRLHRPRPQDVRRRRAARRPAAGGRDDVRPGRRGRARPTGIRPPACWTGASPRTGRSASARCSDSRRRLRWSGPRNRDRTQLETRRRPDRARNESCASLRSLVVRRLFAATALALGTALTATTAPVVRCPTARSNRRARSSPRPTVPRRPGWSPTWTPGAVLAAKDPTARTPRRAPSRPLLAMVVRRQPRPELFARANASHTEVECSCVGLTPGQPYTTRQLLEGAADGVGQRRREHAGRHARRADASRSRR